ncbi:MAG: hypothetical protein WCO60_10060 [Verrucomicrobiota bacterium]
MKRSRFSIWRTPRVVDLQVAPHELVNLTDRPEHATKVKEMMALLEPEIQAYGDAAPLVVANPAPSKWEPPVQGAPRQKK